MRAGVMVVVGVDVFVDVFVDFNVFGEALWGSLQ